VPDDPVDVDSVEISDKTARFLRNVNPSAFCHIPEYGYNLTIYKLDAVI